MSKKQGVKKGSPQAASFAKRIAYSAERNDMRQREFGRQFGDDMWTLALGRMGWREKRMGDIKKHLEDVNNEFCASVLLDAESDEAIWYTKETLDREIKRYVGDLYVPYEQRYGQPRPKLPPMTNVRNLRTMPIDELADFLAGLGPSPNCDKETSGKPDNKKCREYWLDWLQKEVSD